MCTIGVLSAIKVCEIRQSRKTQSTGPHSFVETKMGAEEETGESAESVRKKE